MKLSSRFFLSHGGIVALTLFSSFFLIYEGALLLYQRQSQLTQAQQLADFQLAAQEALIQHQDVAVLNLMKSILRNPIVSYAVYSNPSAGIEIILPQEFQKEGFFGPPPKNSKDKLYLNRKLSTGQEIVEWTAPLAGPNGGLGRVWIGYSKTALNKDLNDQTQKWLQLEIVVGSVVLILGLLISVGLGRHLARPLKQIDEGTHLVRSGKLDSLVQVDRKDEIGDLARNFNSMVVQLKELDEMKRNFVSGVTHDLGTPLQAIRSSINYLQAGDAGPLTEKQSEYLLMVANSTSNLTSFINNLLTTARIEAAKVEPFPEPLDVYTYVKELVDLYQAQAREKEIKLTLIKKAPYISLVADATMFRQIVLNLLSNALKFTSEGKVDVVLSEDDGDFVLEVVDTGIGIDPQYHTLIFDRFFRVQPPGGAPARQGSGLGLTIVKGLVEAHGGRVMIDSDLGRGSIFRVLLPKQPRSFS